MPDQTTSEAEILFRAGATVTPAAQAWGQNRLAIPYVSLTSGLTLAVRAFAANDGYTSPGGSITLTGNGTWYVGADLFSGEIISLPRLGHRGWVPVGKVTVAGGVVTAISQINPVLPPSRLPRLMSKFREGKATKILVLGSSLAESTGTTVWSGMLFNSSSSGAYYKIPGTITSFDNFALGGTPNQYQLAQVGIGSSIDAKDFGEAGLPAAGILDKLTPPNGRSTMFAGVDLVVITTLANGGDYRLESIEPIIRNLRKMGMEVILTTDNPNGAAQVGGTGPYRFLTQAAATAADLYPDGDFLRRLADLYQIEFADTAAYVVDAVLRYPAVNIYRDAIHMFAAAPAGITGQPGGGYEVYARAIRSVMTISGNPPVSAVLNYTWPTPGSVDGWLVYQAITTVSESGGKLSVLKNSSSTGQWGAQVALPAVNVGDTIRVQGTIQYVGDWTGHNGSIGAYLGGWASNQVSPSAGGNGNTGTFDGTLTITAAGTPTLLFFGNWDAAPSGIGFNLDDLIVTVNSTAVGLATDLLPFRAYEPQALPPSRIVTDLKTPGEAFVILPKDEYHLRLLSNNGTLGASPLGSSSFARRFSSAVGASEDLLTLTTGQRAAISGLGVVGFSVIYYSTNGDPEVTFDVYKDLTFQKTITIAAQTISREIYLPIYTPTQQANGTTLPRNYTIDLRVTSGTLKIAALVALTFEQDFLPPDSATRVGTWTKVTGPTIPGWVTDTNNDFAFFRASSTQRRVCWALANKVNSKITSTWSGQTITADEAQAGSNHMRVRGGHIGPGEMHYLKLKVANAAVDQTTNGYGLHLGGIIIVHDR